jgi:hypothetical protein
MLTFFRAAAAATPLALERPPQNDLPRIRTNSRNAQAKCMMSVPFLRDESFQEKEAWNLAGSF